MPPIFQDEARRAHGQHHKLVRELSLVLLFLRVFFLKYRVPVDYSREKFIGHLLLAPLPRSYYVVMPGVDLRFNNCSEPLISYLFHTCYVVMSTKLFTPVLAETYFHNDKNITT